MSLKITVEKDGNNIISISSYDELVNAVNEVVSKNYTSFIEVLKAELKKSIFGFDSETEGLIKDIENAVKYDLANDESVKTMLNTIKSLFDDKPKAPASNEEYVLNDSELRSKCEEIVKNIMSHNDSFTAFDITKILRKMGYTVHHSNVRKAVRDIYEDLMYNDNMPKDFEDVARLYFASRSMMSNGEYATVYMYDLCVDDYDEGVFPNKYIGYTSALNKSVQNDTNNETEDETEDETEIGNTNTNEGEYIDTIFSCVISPALDRINLPVKIMSKFSNTNRTVFRCHTNKDGSIYIFDRIDVNGDPDSAYYSDDLVEGSIDNDYQIDSYSNLRIGKTFAEMAGLSFDKNIQCDVVRDPWTNGVYLKLTQEK